MGISKIQLSLQKKNRVAPALSTSVYMVRNVRTIKLNATIA